MYRFNKIISAHQNPGHYNIWVLLGNHVDRRRARLLHIFHVAGHQAMLTNNGVNSLKTLDILTWYILIIHR